MTKYFLGLCLLLGGCAGNESALRKDLAASAQQALMDATTTAGTTATAGDCLAMNVALQSQGVPAVISPSVCDQIKAVLADAQARAAAAIQSAIVK